MTALKFSDDTVMALTFLVGVAMVIAGVLALFKLKADNTEHRVAWTTQSGRELTVISPAGGIALVALGMMLMLVVLGAAALDSDTSAEGTPSSPAPGARNESVNAPAPPTNAATIIVGSGPDAETAAATTAQTTLPGTAQGTTPGATGAATVPPPSTPATLECSGQWVVSLGSTEGDTPPDEFLRNFKSLLQDESLRIVETDRACASLTPGIWQVIGGVHATRDAARTECEERNPETGCFIAILTNDPADRTTREIVISS